MAYKHSPEQVASQSFATKKRDWFPWNHTLLSSHSFGRVDPILCEPVTANTTIKLDMFSALQTNPTATPIFDSAVVTDSVFFVPQRILCRGIYADNFMELGTIEDIQIPYLYSSFVTSAPTIADASSLACLPGSLLNRLGYPAHIVTPAGAFIPLDDRHLPAELKNVDVVGSNAALGALFTAESINASPMLAYYAVCERFYSNPYYPEVVYPSTYFESSDNPNLFGELVTQYSMCSLYDVRNNLLAIRGIVNDGETLQSYSDYISAYNPNFSATRVLALNIDYGSTEDACLTSYTFVAPGLFNNIFDMVGTLQNQLSSAGIWCAQYGKGYQTMYFDEEDITQLEYNEATEIGDTVSTVRIARSRFNQMFRTILRGKRFTDWVDINFGAKLKICDHPIFCGSNSYNMFFNDVVNQSANQQGEDGIPLGTAASRGYASKSGSRPISFTTQEPGYLLVLRTIVPNVSYSSVMPRWANMKTMSSFPMPAYSGSTFQDLRVDDIVTTFTQADSHVVGKQPLYFDYMQKFNRLHGVFATHLNESYTFKRETDVSDLEIENIAQNVGSTFIIPSQFNYAFPSIGGVQQQENIFIKTMFNMSVLQPLDRSVLQTNL